MLLQSWRQCRGGDQGIILRKRSDCAAISSWIGFAHMEPFKTCLKQTAWMDQKRNAKMNAQTMHFASLTISFSSCRDECDVAWDRKQRDKHQFCLEKQTSKLSRKETYFPTPRTRVAGALRNTEEGQGGHRGHIWKVLLGRSFSPLKTVGRKESVNISCT